MGGGKAHGRGRAFLMRLQEPRRDQTPAIAGLQAGKSELGPGRGQIIAKVFRQRQKFRRHDGADRVTPGILTPLTPKLDQAKYFQDLKALTEHYPTAHLLLDDDLDRVA